MDHWASQPDMSHSYGKSLRLPSSPHTLTPVPAADRAPYAYDATTLDSAQRYPRQSSAAAQQYYIQSSPNAQSPDGSWPTQQPYPTSPVRDSRYAAINSHGYPQHPPVSHPSLPPPHPHHRSSSYTNTPVSHHHDPSYAGHRPPSRLQTPGPHTDPAGSSGAYFPSSPTTQSPYPHPHLHAHQSPPPPSHALARSPSGTITTMTGERYPCHYCDKTFSRNFDRKRHMETHVPGSSGNNRCRYCRKDYSRADSLKRHLDNGCDHRPRGG